MIADGDRILVAVSGGKDSLALFWTLRERRTRAPVRYEIFPVHIDPGFEGGFGGRLAAFLNESETPLRIEYTDFGTSAHSRKNRENPCFLCSRLRRKRLFDIAAELSCNKVAMGHHKDDIIETLFLNICYSGEISTMLPYQPLFGGKCILIRPLAFAGEEVIRRFADEVGFPDFVNPCPSSADSRRGDIRALLAALYRRNRKVRGNIFRSLSRVKPDYLLK
jgi:tRNA 2-thiocytidine biosynthesis protein TtcA